MVNLEPFKNGNLRKLPAYLTISRGQQFADTDIEQYSRIRSFVQNNLPKFRHDPLRMVWQYIGFDCVIPPQPAPTDGGSNG